MVGLINAYILVQPIINVYIVESQRPSGLIRQIRLKIVYIFLIFVRGINKKRGAYRCLRTIAECRIGKWTSAQ